ncbi:MAG: hypothetical protein KDC82_07125 [Bacteroidetes bacterium]|nr:hypothetical protein [Bacteroidota bacterium]
MSDHKKLDALNLRVEYLEKILKDLMDNGLKAGQAANVVMQNEVTFKVGKAIRQAYDEIEQSIEIARSQGKSDLVTKLQELKKDVPKKYAISKEAMATFVDTLNSILGGQQSKVV